MALESDTLWREAAARLLNAGIESPAMEAQLLLAQVLGVARLAVLRGIDRPLLATERATFEDLVCRRAAREPHAYLRGTQEFYGLEFEVSPAVLIPRPETELLVEFARRRREEEGVRTLADVGTGSGCIAVCAATVCPLARVLATDLSLSALQVAKRNAARHQVGERVAFVRADLLTGAAHGAFDLVLSNPPYIPSCDIAGLMPEVREHEPVGALDGGADGLAFYRRLAAQTRGALRPGGSLAVEVGAGQAPDVTALFERAGLVEITVERDLAGIERLVAGRRPAAGRAQLSGGAPR